jgi:hypothetical protein
MSQDVEQVTNKLWVLNDSPEAYAILRNVPVQRRSRIQLANIVFAGLVTIVEIGRDNFRTEDIAQAANVSIGTFYRYFKDRVALLDYLWPERRDTYFELNGLEQAHRALVIKDIERRQEAIAALAAEEESAHVSELSLVG